MEGMYFIFVYLVKGEIENWKNAYLINLFPVLLIELCSTHVLDI